MTNFDNGRLSAELHPRWQATAFKSRLFGAQSELQVLTLQVSVQSRFAETLTLTLTLNPNFGESGFGETGFGESGRHRKYLCFWRCEREHRPAAVTIKLTATSHLAAGKLLTSLCQASRHMVSNFPPG